MAEDKYGKVAQEIRVLLEKKFGKFSFEDFDKVVEVIQRGAPVK